MTVIATLLLLPIVAQTTVKIETPECRQKMQVFGLNGTGYVVIANLKAVQETKTLDNGEVEKKRVYTWNAPDRTPAVYYIGSSMRSYVPVVVGGDPNILITAECRKINQATVSGSSINQAYGQMRQQLNANNRKFSQLNQQLRQAKSMNKQADIDKVVQEIKALDAQKLAYLKELQESDPFLGRIAAVSTYTSYAGEDNSPYSNEAEHYVNTFWKHADFSDAGFNGLNALYEASNGYTSTLLRVVKSDKAEDILNRLIDKWPAGSKARFYVMGAAFNVLNQQNNAAAFPIAERLVTEYKASEPVAVHAVEKAFSKLKTSMPGFEAPNLVGQSPTGETIDLKDLRGKVVLLDFWASWCGPCRRENPNVKKLYDKYAEKGFEILGVSLDRTKDRWEKAIADDKLNWLHISDLKHWQSAHAALYGVRSIPDTVLLDKDGKIIARGLRGDQLEATLAKLFAGK